MPFAPHEIENKKFVIALRGYQKDEVEAFLRAVAADYRMLLEQKDSASPDRWVADVEHVMRFLRWAREEAEREAAELRAAATAEAAALREAAQRDADERREATERETEACFAEIARQAEELHRLKTSLLARVHALEHTVFEARQTLAHVSELYPMTADVTNGNGSAPVTAETNRKPAVA
jgi:DivIVA domain-containing protein